MKRVMRAVLVAAGLALAAAPTGAQVVVRRFGGASGGPGAQLLDAAPPQYGVREWRVGQWARYSVSQNLGGPMPMVQFRTISIVGRRGADFWVETAEEFSGIASGHGPVRKMLVAFGALVERVGGEAYVMNPDSSVRRESLVRGGGERARPAFPEGWTRLGEESLTTPAGAVRSVHWRRGEDDAWVSAEAGPIGLVRYRSTAAEIELVGRGESGARSRIPFGGSDR
jgi:hypothetical protein